MDKVGITGRPSIYTDDLAVELCTQIAEGRSLRKICDREDMPALRTVMYWLRDNESFLQQYTRAREEQAESYADEIIDIADTEPDANKARVRVDSRKWVVSKLLPKKYGDKLDLTSMGKELPAPILGVVKPNETNQEWYIIHKLVLENAGLYNRGSEIVTMHDITSHNDHFTTGPYV